LLDCRHRGAALGFRSACDGGFAEPSRPCDPDGAHRRLLARSWRQLRLQRQEGTYPDIRLVYWAGGNPFHRHQDVNRLRRAWQRPETVIVHEPWWTATARHADIVLPTTTTLERNDIGAAHRDCYVLSMQQAIEPIGQARSDFAIFTDLARRLGCEVAYAEGRDEMAWLRHLYEG
jgi:biotin/methionine sulfoxide reductase